MSGQAHFHFQVTSRWLSLGQSHTQTAPLQFCWATNWALPKALELELASYLHLQLPTCPPGTHNHTHNGTRDCTLPAF